MVVAVDKDHIIFSVMGSEVESLRVSVKLLYILQVLAKEAVQVGIALVTSQFDDVLFRKVEGDAMLGDIGQIGDTFAAPGADLEVIFY